MNKRLLLEINTIYKFLLFRMNYIIDGSFFIIETHNYFIIPMHT